MADRPVVLITGASSGIGAAAARLFAKNGYAVILAARSLEQLEALASEIEASGGRAIAIRTDVTQLADIENLISESLREFGAIDVLINNAGIGHVDWFENLDIRSGIDHQIQTNLIGLIQITRVIVPHMVVNRRGHIINVASIASLIGTPTYSVYAAGKFGVRGFSEALRRELLGLGIAVSVIYPGSVKNEFGIRAGMKRKTRFTTPTWLKLSSEDVAKALMSLVRHPRRSLVVPRLMLAPVWLNAIAPGFIDWVIQKRFVEREKAGGEKLNAGK